MELKPVEGYRRIATLMSLICRARLLSLGEKDSNVFADIPDTAALVPKRERINATPEQAKKAPASGAKLRPRATEF